MANKNTPHEEPVTPPELMGERYGEGEAWPLPGSSQAGTESDESAQSSVANTSQASPAEILTPDAQEKLEELRGANASLRLARTTMKLAGPGAERDAAALRLRQAEREVAVATSNFYEAMEAARSDEP
jgi:hypothetical protein